ncbi:MAG: COR domain-containing protein, partial [Nitrosospira sp.]
GLTALQTLNISDTQVTDLAPLSGLTALQTLNISDTQVTDLVPLRCLINRGCPVRWSSDVWKSNGIHVENCPLVNPPVEIVNQGNEAILNYFHERDLGDVDHLYEAKLLILGEGGAGKTSLLRRLYQPGQPLPMEHETTRGITIHRHNFSLKNGRRFHLNVWDFGGQEIYHATHQFFLTRRSLYLLLDDTRKDHKSVSEEGFKYWLELIDLFGGHSPVLIFQNEKGGRSKAIDLAGIKGQHDNVKELYAGNLEHATAADKLREGIEFYASNLSHIGEQLPARWIKVRADIEARASEVPHITQQEYFDIYRRHMEFDQSKALHLSRYLHDLGVFLHFQDDPLLSRTVILQNSWATEAVFQILDNEPVKAQLGRFTSADCERLWQDSVYADMHPELLALMQRFELCYRLADTKPQTWLAPQLLPPAKPGALTGWGKPEDLVLRYRYDFMPKGIISRLMVRLHRFVGNTEMAWVTGVLFERDSTQVLVELLANGSEIELRARGPERKALLSVIAADLDALNESFQGLRDKVDKRITCNCNDCCTAPVPEFFAYKELLRRKEHSRLKVECPQSYEEVDVLNLLDGIRVDRLPGWAKEVAPALRTIQIFLASSTELREDRDAFDLYFRQQNDQFLKKGLYLKIVRWENFLDAMSETRMQDEYNEAVRTCDIFVSLFFTRTGKFSEEEFDTAHHQFLEIGRPLIYTFFKNADIKTGDAQKEDLMSMWAFKEKLGKLGHFCTNYDDAEHLKCQFRDQLDKMDELLRDA